jgi:hypothetical protein
MVRRGILLLIILLFSFSLADSFLDIKGTLKGVLEVQFSKAMQKKVTIESIDGNFSRELILNNVTIAGDHGVIAQAKRIEVEYSLKKIILNKFNALPYISRITIYSPYVNIVRDRAAQWNIFAGSSGGRSDVLTELKLAVRVVDGAGRYTDYLGFTKQSKTFSTKLHHLNAMITIDRERLKYTLEGKAGLSEKILIEGSSDQLTGQYKIAIRLPKLGIREWSPYLMAQGLVDGKLNGYITLGGMVGKKPWYSGSIRVQDGLYISGTSNVVTNINGTIMLNNITLNIPLMTARVQTTVGEIPVTLSLVDRCATLNIASLVYQGQYIESIALARFNNQTAELTVNARMNAQPVVAVAHVADWLSPEKAKVSGGIRASKIFVFGEYIPTLSLQYTYERGDVVADGVAQLLRSTIDYDFHYAVPSRNLELQCSTSALLLTDVYVIQKYLPEITGTASIQAKVIFNKTLSVNVIAALQNISFNELEVQAVSVDVGYAPAEVIVRSYAITLADSAFHGSGFWYWDPKVEKINLNNSRMRVSLMTEGADLGWGYGLYQKVNKQYKRITTRLAQSVQDRPIHALRIVTENIPLYSEDSTNNVIAFLKQAVAETNTDVAVLPLTIRGKAKGNIDFENNHGKLIAQADAEVTSASINDQSCTWAELRVSTDGSTVSLLTNVRQVQIAPEVRYDQVAIAASLADGILTMQQFDLTRGSKTSRDCISGSFPLYALWDSGYYDRPIDLTVTMYGDDVSLLARMVKSITYMKHSGVLTAKLQGTYRHPLVNTNQLDFNMMHVGLRDGLYDEVLVRRLQAVVSNNILTLGTVELALIKGNKETPVFKLSGAISVSNWSLAPQESVEATILLLLKDMTGEIDLKNTYKGSFGLQNVSLAGKLSFPLSAMEKQKLQERIIANAEHGPLLTGTLSLSQGTILLKKVETIDFTRHQYPSIILNVDCQFKNDVRAAANESILSGDYFSNFISQISMTLKDDMAPLMVEGTVNHPKISGRIGFDDGYISFFNRKFTLIDAKEQEQFFSAGERRPANNYLEFKEITPGKYDPEFLLVARTTVYEAVPVSQNTTTGNQNTTQYYQEKEYLVSIDGPLNDVSSIRFDRYVRQQGEYKSEGEPYVLKDKTTGRMIDANRFQELSMDIAPPLLKSAFAMAAGNADTTTEGLTRDVAREMTITEINMLARQVLRPLERGFAQNTGLYDVRLRRDFGQDAVNLLNLQDQRVLVSQEQIQVSHEVGLEVVKELWRERLFFSVDTNLDRNLQSEQLNWMIYSYKLTWKIFKGVFLDEISLNYGNEIDSYRKYYIPVLSLEAVHSF